MERDASWCLAKRAQRWHSSCQPDIESMHHDERIWGLDALEFCTDRFSKLTQDQKDAYMLSGIGKNVCIAISSFGRKVIRHWWLYFLHGSV
ncbi:cytochrome P450 [Colletotrichum tofieldiae]|uniref:Cytochrome P450 n=1 Tax=Colletotrichum tofieldiae TaxID=708197 RepID=A0A166RI40_9PEZI|nr:cytochrome P450 [Colletotrichum tofieldiae]